MRNRLSTILASLVLWLSSPALQAGDKLSLQSLTVPEMQTFIGCRRSFFAGDACKQLVNKVCGEPENKEVWQCLENTWANCSESDFATPECLATVKTVCTKTKDNYDYVCDRTKYETCLQDEFRPSGCADARIAFSLPILKKQIEDIERSEQTRPVNTLLLQRYCELSSADPSSPLANACKTPAISLDEVLTEYPKLKRPAANPKALREMFESFAANDLTSDGLFNSIELSFIWMEIADSTAGKSGEPAVLRRAVAQSYAKAGPDDLLATFLLIEMSSEADALIRAAAVKGLSQRSYRSSLAMAAILKGLTDEDEAVRREAIQGVGKRWLQDAQVVLTGVDPLTKLRVLIDCNAVRVDPNFYNKILSVEDLKSIDFSAPEALCSMGKAANLTRLKNDLMNRFISNIGNSELSSEERIAAAKSFHILVVSPQEWPGIFERLKPSLGDSNQALAGHVLESLVRILPNKQAGDEDAPLAITQKFSQLLANHLRFLYRAGDKEDQELKALHQLLINKGLLQTYKSLRQPNLYRLTIDECVASNSLSLLRRMNCFSSLVPSSPEAEVQAWPLARAVVEHGNFAERQRLTELYNSSAFSFRKPPDRSMACSEVLDQVNTLTAIMIKRIENPLSVETSALGSLYRAFDYLLRDGQMWQESCVELRDARSSLLNSLRQPRLNAAMLSVVQSNFPKLPMKAWYDEFSTTKTDVIEITRIPEAAAQQKDIHLHRTYSTRKDIADEKIPQNFPTRVLDVVIIRDFAWEPYKKLLAEALGWELKSDTDAQFETLYWGVTPPSITER